MEPKGEGWVGDADQLSEEARAEPQANTSAPAENASEEGGTSAVLTSGSGNDETLDGIPSDPEELRRWVERVKQYEKTVVDFLEHDPKVDLGAAVNSLSSYTRAWGGAEESYTLFSGIVKGLKSGNYDQWRMVQLLTGLCKLSPEEGRYRVNDYLNTWLGELKNIRRGDPDNRDDLQRFNDSSEALTSAMTENIMSLIELEQKKPGVTKQLTDDFGIKHFSRYPSEMLVNQVEEGDKSKEFLGVVLFPMSDPSGAFYHKKYILQYLFDDIGQQSRIIIFECKSKASVARALIKTSQKNAQGGQKIDFAIIAGHGGGEHIRFGDEFRSYDEIAHDFKLTVDNLEGKGVRKSGKFFSQNPTFILLSCSSGKDSGIGQGISSTFSAEVFAPATDTATSLIHAKVENGKLIFDVGYGPGPQDETIRFQDGNATSLKS